MNIQMFRIQSMLRPQNVAGSVRGFAKISERAKRRKMLREQKKNVKQMPFLKDTMRKLYMRTHPDLFGQYPEQQEQNETSYKELLGILDTIKSGAPSAATLDLPFYLRTNEEGKFNRVVLNLRTAGGASQSLVQASLGTFFEKCGLPPAFKWEEGTWGVSMTKPVHTDEDEESEEAKEEEQMKQQQRKAQQKREEPAPAYSDPFKRNDPDQSIENVLETIDDTLKIVAVCPILPDEEQYNDIKKHFLEGTGIEELEQGKFKLKAAVDLIWNGEQDLNVLVKGLDAESAQIINRIRLHAMDIERQLNEAEQRETEENEKTTNE